MRRGRPGLQYKSNTGAGALDLPSGGVKEITTLKNREGSTYGGTRARGRADRLWDRVRRCLKGRQTPSGPASLSGLLADFQHYWIMDALSMQIHSTSYTRGNQSGRLHLDGSKPM